LSNQSLGRLFAHACSSQGASGGAFQPPQDIAGVEADLGAVRRLLASSSSTVARSTAPPGSQVGGRRTDSLSVVLRPQHVAAFADAGDALGGR
jgi:hypothetical protein